MVRYRFSRDLQKAEEPYNLYALSGNSWHNLSFDAGYTLQQMHVFGEVAGAGNGGKALLAGCLLSLDNQADIVACYTGIYHPLPNGQWIGVYGWNSETR
ncbi:MAG: hypothetical protein U0T56_03260 [Ferruginibacter sp.]